MNEGLEALERVRETLATIQETDCNIIEKDLKDYEWLKSKIGIDFFYQLSSDDRVKLAEILGVKL